MKKFFPMLILVFLFAFNGFGQEMKKNYFKRTYFYSFTNVTSIDQVNQLKTDIEGLKDVVKVKAEYKPESTKGQVIVIVVEPEMTSEGQEYFDIVAMKRLILKNNLVPHDLIQEKVKFQK